MAARYSSERTLEIAAEAADHLSGSILETGGNGPEILGALSTVVAMVVISAMPGATDAQYAQALDMVRRHSGELLPDLRDGP